MIKKIFDPYKIFIALLVVMAFWIAPVGSDVAEETEPVYPPVLAEISGVSAACSNSCTESVCLKWVPPGGSCQPENPWDIGCCTKWGTTCNLDLPGCSVEEPPPPPPPVYSPPTVSASLTCGAWGDSGWCKNNGKVSFTASDPQGFAVTIDGKVIASGVSPPFSCASPCKVDMASGSGSVSYKGTAATSGMSSAAGSIAFKFDAGKPVITSSISGSQNGVWYNSAGTTVTASASDVVSGVQSVSITRNGAAVTSPFPLPDGTHDISVAALDVAGNQSTSSFTVKVDSVKPLISFNVAGVSGGVWYRSATIAVDASDATSGVQNLVITDNGKVKPSPISPGDGVHDIVATANDNAGNVQSSSYNIKVDGTPPTIVPSITGTAGDSGWWVSAVDIDAAVNDAMSGVATQSSSPDGGGSWASTPYSLSADGIYQVSFKSEDNAGNVTEISETVKIDKSLPTLSVSKTGTEGENGWHTSSVVNVSLSGADAISGVRSVEYRLNGGAWTTGTLIPVEGDGVYSLEYRIYDNAGNVFEQTDTLRIDTNAPVSTIDSPSNETAVDNTVQIIGKSSDGLSGLAGVEVSTDGGATWNSVTAGNWSYLFNTKSLQNGKATVSVRARDQAGNVQPPVTTTLFVDNEGPIISLPESWTVDQSGGLLVQKNYYDVASVSISIMDKDGNILSSKIGPSAPGAILWSGKFNGELMPAGKYPVVVAACDVYGVCSTSTAFITIPIFYYLLPTQAVETPQVVVVPAAEPVVVESEPLPLPDEPQSFGKTVIANKKKAQSIILLASLAFVLLLAAQSVTDPRPKAMKSLEGALRKNIKNKK